jgi:hypothetical protein
MHQPQDFGGLVWQLHPLTRMGGPGRFTDEKAGTRSRLQVPGGYKPIVGLYHRELADAVSGGEPTNGGQPGSLAKPAFIHQTPDPTHDLFGDCAAPRWIDVD